MTIDKVTSLADLEFKAKTDKYYKQLAILGAKRCNGGRTIPSRINTYEKAIAFLQDISLKHNPDSCSAVVHEVNLCCSKIVEEVEPSPAVEATTPSTTTISPVAASVETLKAIVAATKKKATSKKKTTKARGARSSTRSRTPTPTTRRRSTKRSKPTVKRRTR